MRQFGLGLAITAAIAGCVGSSPTGNGGFATADAVSADSLSFADATASDAGTGSNADSATKPDAINDAAPADAPAPQDSAPLPDAPAPADAQPPLDVAPPTDAGPAPDTADASTPKTCGGFAGLMCNKSQMCNVLGCGADMGGECVPWVPACPPSIQPVCGCNGITFPGDCERIKAGVAKKSDGACPGAATDCQAAGPNTCPAGQYCVVPLGQCAGLGVCTKKPDMCLEPPVPVCGCDGKTYPNKCLAILAGVNLSANGECPPVIGKVCGGKMGLPCAPNEICDPDGCGADMTGTCKPAAVNPCPKTMPAAQQCGCDGVTYANECERLLNKVAKASDGPCPLAGCAPGAGTCGKGQFCQSPEGLCGAVGNCVAVPMGCIDLWQPVCGCDGNTYGNSCDAAAASQTVLSKGECPKPLCNADSDCPWGNECLNGTCSQCVKPCPKIMCMINMKMNPCTCKCEPIPPPPP